MTYSTHIPKTTYAQRHASFLSQREEARRSAGNCEAMHGVLIRVCLAKLDRNYIDADEIGRGTRQIVKISHVMRELRPLAEQPDPPRHEPVTPARNSFEARTYGGVKASRLVRVLRYFKSLRQTRGPLAVFRRASRLSPQLVVGLDIYKRVKTLVADLISAVDAPDTAITARPKTKSPAPVVSVKWEVSPQKIYGWNTALKLKGYDPRQTSVYWLEKQATALKRAVYHAHYGVDATRRNERRTAAPSTDKKIKVRTFIPPKGATQTEQVWPPIDLVRMIEERRSFSSPTCGGSGCSVSKGNVELDGGTSRSEVLLVKETEGHHEAPPTSRCSAPSDPSVFAKRKAHLPRHAVEESNGTRKHEPWCPEP